MPTIRPARPKWISAGSGFYASTALGGMKVDKTGDGYWIATLNDAPFPVLYESLDLARQSAAITAARQGQPANLPLQWTPNSLEGESADFISGTFHIARSEDISGYFVMQGDDPAQVFMAASDEACEACAQYLTFVWYALSEVV